MRTPRRLAWLAVPAALALVVSGCGGGGDDEDSGATASLEVKIHGTQPENPLVPCNTTETGGGKVIEALWTGLVGYNGEKNEVVNQHAESIDSSDSKTYTIKIKDGWTFHDGSPVTAQSYVDSWNWCAYGPNANQNATFFENIDGFADVYTEDPDGPEGPQTPANPKATEMKGLKVVDDTTFEVTLSAPFAAFEKKIRYSAFMPLPKAFLDNPDPAAFGKKPVGNGPTKFVSWQDNASIKVERFDDYKGDDKVKVKGIEFKIYQEDTAAYADLLSNNLDGMETIPANALAGSKWKADLGDRILERDIPVMQIIAFPMYDPRFQKKELRQAVSLAINREEIADKIFEGTRTPSASFISNQTEGSRDDACKYCVFDPAQAKQKLQQAGGFQGEMAFFYNADASHKDWMEAVASQVKQNLGINAVAKPVPTFAQFRQQVNAYTMTGPYRAAWQEDYPDPENWLNPLLKTGGSSNDGKYSNPAVDKLLEQGNAATSEEESIKLYQEAEDLVAEDMPTMPIFHVEAQGGYSTKVSMKFDPVGEILLSSIEAAS